MSHFWNLVPTVNEGKWFFWQFLSFGCIHLLNTRKYCDNTCKYCSNTHEYWANTHEYWANTWKMWSPASTIFTSIVTILVSFEAIWKRVFVKINFKSQFQSNDVPQALKYIKIASKLTSIVTILANIALAGEHIFQVLGQYSWVLPQYLQVLSQYLRALSRWIHPLGLILSCLIEKVKNANKGCNFYILQK